MDWLGWLTIFFGVLLLIGVGLFALARVRWRQGGRAMAQRIDQIRAEQQRMREAGYADQQRAQQGPDYRSGSVVLPGEVVDPQRPGDPQGAPRTPDAGTPPGTPGGSAQAPAAWQRSGTGMPPGRGETLDLSGPSPIGTRAAGVAYGCLAGPLAGLGLVGLLVCGLIAIFR